MHPLVGLFIGVGITATAPLLVKLALGGATPVVVATYRMVLASLVVLPVALLLARPAFRRFTTRSLALTAAAGLLLALSFAAWMASMTMTSVTSSVVLATTMPLWVALASPFLTSDRVNAPTLAGVLIAMGGGAVISGGDAGLGGAALLGNGLALFSAVTNAGQRLLARMVRTDVPLLPYVAVVYPVAAVALLVTALASNQPLTGLSDTTGAYLVLLALGPQVLGHSLYNWALGRLSAVIVPSGIMTETVFSVSLAAAVLGQPPALNQVAGGAVVLAGAYLTMRAQTTAQRRATPATAGTPLTR